MSILEKLFDSKIDFGNCNEKQLTGFIKTHQPEGKATKDYTSQHWGHTCEVDKTINESPLVFRMHGFDGDGQIIGSRQKKLRVGDEVLLRVQGGKTAVYSILEIEFCNDPRDMFFGTMVGIGYKEDDE